MCYQAHSNESGRNMFEAIAYIMIMILVTMSAAALVNSGLGKFRIGKVNQELMDLKGEFYEMERLQMALR